MLIFVLTATYELRVSRKNHLRDHPTSDFPLNVLFFLRYLSLFSFLSFLINLLYPLPFLSFSALLSLFLPSHWSFFSISTSFSLVPSLYFLLIGPFSLLPSHWSLLSNLFPVPFPLPEILCMSYSLSSPQFPFCRLKNLSNKLLCLSCSAFHRLLQFHL
jgi:hypothetical protein